VPGIFNIVPSEPAPLRAALRAAGCRRVAAPWSLQPLAQAVARRGNGRASTDQRQFLRCHLTASGDKARAELGFDALDSSLDTVAEVAGSGTPAGLSHRSQAPCDPFGLDREYIDRCERGFMGFLRRRYWRIETRGLEHLPRSGGGVLVGMHRGFMPFDGVMTLLTIVGTIDRVPRFLIHPGVGLRFPFLFDLMSKLGGVIACQANGDRVLDSGQLLGIYPEGIRGAFTMYRDAYRIGPAWRNDCMAFALRHGVPLVPFVTLGSAEIFPILGRIKSRRWKRYSEWPFIPITPTFPLLPVPLPSKWHTLFLEPMHVERDYTADAATDPRIIGAVAAELKTRMERALAELRERRRSIFFGSIFDATDVPVQTPR
jgi:1-acyl-sn-glycerol-3-phosphate acyltransferase